MAFSRKNKRRIVVDSHLLYWSVTGGDTNIHSSILSPVEKSGRVFAAFDYHHIRVPVVNNGQEYVRLTNPLIITPYTVRQVVQLALAQGWNPQEKSDNLCLGFVDEKVDLRLHQNRVGFHEHDSIRLEAVAT